MSFDDILYFSHILPSGYPNIYKLIKARYPYTFVDEFQDTIPFVVDFLTLLDNDGVVIGVIGDKAQSIYDLLGATVQQFDNFALPEMQEFEIRGNRRSTKQIIELLGIVRTDFSQDWLNGAEGVVPELLVGDVLNYCQQSIEKSGTDKIQSLAFQNVLANSMHNKNGMRKTEKTLEMDFDSNVERQMMIKALIKVAEYIRMDDLRNAWHQLDIMNRERSLAIVLLRHLLNGYKDYKDGSMMDFYNFLVNDLHVKMLKVKKKIIKDFYMDHTYADAALGVKYGDSNDKHKTIHKSKGEEYSNVFVILKEEDDVEFPLTSDLNGNNAHRVYYVVAGRVIKRLFINVPTLSAENRIKFEGKPINILQEQINLCNGSKRLRMVMPTDLVMLMLGRDDTGWKYIAYHLHGQRRSFVKSLVVEHYVQLFVQLTLFILFGYVKGMIMGRTVQQQDIFKRQGRVAVLGRGEPPVVETKQVLLCAIQKV